jgi:DNA-binding PadR family transcriptional regulator
LFHDVHLYHSISEKEYSILNQVKFDIFIDNYIGIRYNDVISRADITELDKRRNTMSNQALTEAVYYILLSLMEPMHGYGIMQNVEALSAGRVKLAAGTLYGALNTLLEKGWIIALPGSQNSRKKEYLITETGKQMVKAEIFRLQELIDNGTRIMKESDV